MRGGTARPLNYTSAALTYALRPQLGREVRWFSPAAGMTRPEPNVGAGFKNQAVTECA